MIRIHLILLIVLLLFASCDHQKHKPISGNISKTDIPVNRKNDTVINNPHKVYGNANVSDPCVKCLLQVIQKSNSYKQATQSVKKQDIIYNIGWVSKKPLTVKVDGNSIGNGMQVDIIQKADSQRVNLSTYLYDNSNSKLYLLSKEMKYEADPLEIDSASLKKIRNSCFWGIACR